MAGSIDQTSMSTMKVLSVFFTLMWRIRVSSAAISNELALLGGRAQFDPEQAQQRSEQALAVAAAEFGVLLEMGLADHLQQHVVRGDHARLALDHHRKAGRSGARGVSSRSTSCNSRGST